VEHHEPDPLRPRFPRVLITGAGGQLGAALRETFPGSLALTREQLDVRSELPADLRADLVLHAAAYTNVDRAEAQPAEAEAVNVAGTRRTAELGAPLVYYSTDYVFDGSASAPYTESSPTAPINAYGRSKLAGEREVSRGWIVRTSWLFGWTSRNFVRTMLELGRERDEVRVVDDQRGCPTFVGHLAAATRELVTLDRSRDVETYHLAAAGECTWAEFAEAIFEDAGLDCRVVRVTSAEFPRPARRPAYSVLRSERPEAPALPHWREGLRACLDRLRAAGEL
jgi:dTDP-4-dehydrorhamnose reductase